MKIHPAFSLLCILLPGLTAAEGLLGGLKEGATKAATAVGDAAGKATTAVTDSIGTTQESLRDEGTPEATRDKLDQMAAATLARLLDEQEDSRALFERSAGYAVFDKREASFYVVAGYGRGVAVDKVTGERTYMKMATTGAGLGFGLGGFASQLVILFEDSARLDRFVAQGLDATAAVDAMAGDDKEQLTMRFSDGKAVYVLTGKGWKIAAKLTGSRYWPDDTLNHP